MGTPTYLVVLSILHSIHCVSFQQFYSFGEKRDTRLPSRDDYITKEIPLTVPISFYSSSYKSIFVNNNGHLSFTTNLPGYKSLTMPVGSPIIAAFLADVDTRHQGAVYYREETKDKTILQRASKEIRKQFYRYSTFEATSLFIATWYKVGHYNNKYNQTNTFQIIIASDGGDSFCTFYYMDNGIQWIQGDAGKSGTGVPEVMAQAGFESKTGDTTLLPGSHTPDAYKFANWTNTDTRGVWMYHIGLVKGDVEVPDLNIASVGASEVLLEVGPQGGCAINTCHTKARCQQYTAGHCCVCTAPYYGNGKACLQPGVPQRINGKMSGVLNGIRIDDADLHSYIVTSGGRTYTAINKIPSALGRDMKVLSAVGGTIGWLFANTVNSVRKNGFMTTGGILKREATIKFHPQNKTVQISQDFLGHDALSYMKMNTVINGEIPVMAEKIDMSNYIQRFTRTGAGEMRSVSTHIYKTNGNSYTFNVNQKLTYDECRYNPSLVDFSTLAAERVHPTYDARERTVRYASTNRILASDFTPATKDPCHANNEICHGNAACVQTGSAYRCQCKVGYQGNGISCTDVDECRTGFNNCDVNAQCNNIAGSFVCRCLSGYTGDGVICTRDLTCADLRCSRNAQCVFINRQPQCECNSGYRGNGVICELIEFQCNEVESCHANAECVYNNFTKRFECQCNEGYSGDGVSDCADTGDGEPELNCKQCHANAKCIYDVARLMFHCQCDVGWTGDGKTCTEIPYEYQCNVLNNCDAHATCVLNAGKYSCQCNAGYQGDGLVCRQSVARDCTVLKNCNKNAVCTQGRCRCRIGWKGDGYICSPSQCNADPTMCDQNARCHPDNILRRYVCRCNDGWVGDGRTCSQTAKECNIVNNCGANAECVLSGTGTYRCRCRSGFDGDGFNCVAPPNCQQNPRLCDPNAACVRSGNDYICLCNNGYRGDGARCTSISRSDSYLIYAQGMSIMRAPFVATQTDRGRQLVMIPGQTAIGIDADCKDNYFYWSDVSGGSISRAKLDGTDSKAVMTELVTGLGSPEGVAVDWLSRNMYWTDSVHDTISVAKLDGSQRKAIIKNGLSNPRAIVVDPPRGKVYWSDWNRTSPKIEVSNMDGSERKTFVSTELGLPNGLTIDSYSQQLCWADAGTQRIECIRFDGVGRRTVYALALYPFDITIANGNFYWTDWHQRSLPSIPFTGGSTNEPISLPYGGNGKLYGIVAVRQQCAAGSNACAVNNGGCKYLCLPNGHRGRTCACPDGVTDDECNRVTK